MIRTVLPACLILASVHSAVAVPILNDVAHPTNDVVPETEFPSTPSVAQEAEKIESDANNVLCDEDRANRCMCSCGDDADNNERSLCQTSNCKTCVNTGRKLLSNLRRGWVRDVFKWCVGKPPSWREHYRDNPPQPRDPEAEAVHLYHYTREQDVARYGEPNVAAKLALQAASPAPTSENVHYLHSALYCQLLVEEQADKVAVRQEATIQDLDHSIASIKDDIERLRKQQDTSQKFGAFTDAVKGVAGIVPVIGEIVEGAIDLIDIVRGWRDNELEGEVEAKAESRDEAQRNAIKHLVKAVDTNVNQLRVDTRISAFDKVDLAVQRLLHLRTKVYNMLASAYKEDWNAEDRRRQEYPGHGAIGPLEQTALRCARDFTLAKQTLYVKVLDYKEKVRNAQKIDLQIKKLGIETARHPMPGLVRQLVDESRRLRADVDPAKQKVQNAEQKLKRERNNCNLGAALGGVNSPHTETLFAALIHPVQTKKFWESLTASLDLFEKRGTELLLQANSVFMRMRTECAKVYQKNGLPAVQMEHIAGEIALFNNDYTDFILRLQDFHDARQLRYTLPHTDGGGGLSRR